VSAAIMYIKPNHKNVTQCRSLAPMKSGKFVHNLGVAGDQLTRHAQLLYLPKPSPFCKEKGNMLEIALLLCPSK
jgi:hypothetical protein